MVAMSMIPINRQQILMMPLFLELHPTSVESNNGNIPNTELIIWSKLFVSHTEDASEKLLSGVSVSGRGEDSNQLEGRSANDASSFYTASTMHFDL